MPKYYYINRPPSIGCQPDGWIEREGWRPRRDVNGRPFHGFAVYEQKLTPKQIWQYELYPEDIMERAKQVFYNEPEALYNDYMTTPIEALKEWANTCRYCQAALILRGEQC